MPLITPPLDMMKVGAKKAPNRHANASRIFYQADLFIIADELKSADGKPHDCEALFHLDAPDVVVNALRVTTQNSGPNLSITAFGAEGVKIVKGQKQPVVQGWLPDDLPYGVPAFNFNQLERGYAHTHHSQSDTYDMAVAADLMQASAVMAVSAYELANLSGLIPRGERAAPTPVQAVKVSDSLLVKGTR